MLWKFNGEQEAADPSYTDTKGHWGEKAIGWGTAAQIVDGYPDNTFLPDNNIKRAEVAQIIWKIAGKQDAAAANFTDVIQGEWYAPAVNWCAANGIVKGYGDGTFGTSDPIQRGHMALILYRAKDLLKK